jgi:hypothetical protein
VLPALLLFVLAFRAFAPPGYMIGEGSGGSTALVICPGLQSATPPHHHGHHGKSDPAQHREGPCPFAAMAAAALPPAPPVFQTAAPVPDSPLLISLRAETRRPAPASPPPPSTGPPARA